MQLELEQVVMKYDSLRVAKPGFQWRLMASLASEGQLQPVLVNLVPLAALRQVPARSPPAIT
jgi:hypothetical protein